MALSTRYKTNDVPLTESDQRRLRSRIHEYGPVLELESEFTRLDMLEVVDKNPVGLLKYTGALEKR